MDIQTFQKKLGEIRTLAAENQNVLTGEMVRNFFDGLNPDKEQLLQILKYLKVQGITIQGLEFSEEQKEAEEEIGVGVPSPVKISLTQEEKEYLKNYKASLDMEYDENTAKELFRKLSQGVMEAKGELTRRYLGVAADIAAEMYGQEMLLADLIQEANLSLLTALEKEAPNVKDDAWLRKEIRKGVREALEEQTRRNFEDDCLVAKVQNLESAVRDLSEGEDGEESKFTVGELAIILDMDIEEIRDVLRLTGDSD